MSKVLYTIEQIKDRKYFTVFEKEGYEDLVVIMETNLNGVIFKLFEKDLIDRICGLKHVTAVYGGNKITE